MKRPVTLIRSLIARHPVRFLVCVYACLALVLLSLILLLYHIVSGVHHLPATQSSSQSSGTGTTGSAAGGYPYVSGQNMYDAQGRILHLRGAMLETSFAYIKDYINKRVNPLDDLNSATFQAMKSWDMNAVRINISQWIQQADTSNQYLVRLDTAITAANQSGLYVILDFHNDAQSGATGIYDDQMLHKTSESWWVNIASRYKSNPMVLFDLANEPKYTTWDSWAHGDGSDIVGLLDVTQAIRQAGVRNIIVLEPGSAAKAGTQLKGWNALDPSVITDKDTVISKHDYSEIPDGYFSADAKSYWNNDWGTFIGKRPLLYGEWAVLPHPDGHPSFCRGVTSGNADAVTNAFLAYMQSIGASWTAWSFTPTHMIDSWADLQPTSMQTGAPWSCPVTSGTALNAGMGADIKAFLQRNQ